MRRRAFLVTTVAVGAPLVAGCGGGGGSEGGDSDGSGGGVGGSGDGESGTADRGDAGGSTTTGPNGESAGRSAYPNYNWDRLAEVEATQTCEIVLSNFEFDPLVGQVSAGAEITFVNEDSAGHAVTIPALDVDEQIAGGAQTTISVERAGTYDYVCALHAPDMLGRLVVE